MSRLKQALAVAEQEAAGAPVGPDHLLLGVLEVPDALAVRILERLRVSCVDLERKVRDQSDTSSHT